MDRHHLLALPRGLLCPRPRGTYEPTPRAPFGRSGASRRVAEGDAASPHPVGGLRWCVACPGRLLRLWPRVAVDAPQAPHRSRPDPRAADRTFHDYGPNDYLLTRRDPPWSMQHTTDYQC